VFDLVEVLSLDVTEDVPDSGTDHGEDDAGNHDCCDDHGSQEVPMASEHHQKPPGSFVPSLVSSSPQRRHALL
jgi:hypothetical protein